MRPIKTPRPDSRKEPVNRTASPPAEKVLPTYAEVLRERLEAHKRAATHLTTIRRIYIYAEEAERVAKNKVEDIVALMVIEGVRPDDTFDFEVPKE